MHCARLPPIFALVFRAASLRYRPSCKSYSKTVALPDSPAFIVPVLYNKNDLVEPPPYFIAPPCLVYAQKPASFSEDREYRYVLSCKVGTKEDPFLTLKVGPCTDICSLVP